MKTRIITGALFGLIFLSAVVLGGSPFLLFCTTAMAIGIYEYMRMGFRKANFFVHLTAIIYITSSFSAFSALGLYYGPMFTFYLLLIIWGTDSFAYFVGRKVGKRKLAPSISPNKTWEGSIGGTVIATVLATMYFVFLKPFEMSILPFLALTVLLSVAGQLGDLIESYVKRKYGVKDSGNILPGHGGILDRFDSLMLVSLVAFLLLL